MVHSDASMKVYFPDGDRKWFAIKDSRDIRLRGLVEGATLDIQGVGVMTVCNVKTEEVKQGRNRYSSVILTCVVS